MIRTASIYVCYLQHTFLVLNIKLDPQKHLVNYSVEGWMVTLTIHVTLTSSI